MLAATGCSTMSNVRVPHIFGANEVPPDVISTPRLVETAPSDETQQESWPRLGDVPSKPTNFTGPVLVTETKAEMNGDRLAAQAVKRDYEASGAAITAGQLPPDSQTRAP